MNELEEKARKGNPEAIAALLSDRLVIQDKNIIVRGSISNNFLEIILETKEIPDRTEMVEIIRQELTELEPESVKIVKVAAKKSKETNYAWTQEFGLEVGAFSYLILPDANKKASEPVTLIPEETEPENHALSNEQLSKITLGIVAAILTLAIIVFIGKMLIQRSPSDDEKNSTAYARVILS